MNVIFTAVFIISVILILFSGPDKLLPALLGGTRNSLKSAVTLFCIYAVWTGISALAEKSGLSNAAAKGLKPLSKKIFATDDEEANVCLAMNISCNLLGLGGAATPYAVRAIKRLQKENNFFACNLLFIINATSIQILPTTVISLRASAGSLNPTDIFLPSLICTAVSTLTAVLIYLIWRKLCRT